VTTNCPKCGQSYELATIRLKGKDRTATCGGCGHRFVVKLPARDAKGAAPMTQRGRPAPGSAGGGLAPHVRVALTPLDGPLKDRVLRIAAGTALIGREQGDVSLPDPKVSSRHAEVHVSGGEVWLHDLGSTNGTFVNGERIDRRRLVHLDEVTVGATRLLYTYIEDFVSAYDSYSPDA
jgi:DNA-directed RNA polymerase subunit RPC12/RpoP